MSTVNQWLKKHRCFHGLLQGPVVCRLPSQGRTNDLLALALRQVHVAHDGAGVDGLRRARRTASDRLRRRGGLGVAQRVHPRRVIRRLQKATQCGIAQVMPRQNH